MNRNLPSSLVKSADRWLSARSRNVVLLTTLAVAVLIGLADVHGSDGILIVYIVPIAVAAWYGGRRVGIVVAVYCALAWFLSARYAAGFEVVKPGELLTFVARAVMFLVLTGVIARLRASMRLQKQLTQFIVHDLRSPISSSITGLQTLQELSPNLDQTSSEMVTLALVSNQRALALVNSILDMAKLESGKMPVRPEALDVARLVDDCVEQLALWARANSVEIHTYVRVKEAELDPVLTSRVLVNLLSNALKFSPPNTQIDVAAVPGAHGTIHFSVRDHGPGVPAEFLQTVFEPFNQVKDDKGPKGGTGLGLTFCRLAVTAQGGRIWMESQVGKGTTTHFSLPLQGMRASSG